MRCATLLLAGVLSIVPAPARAAGENPFAAERGAGSDTVLRVDGKGVIAIFANTTNCVETSAFVLANVEGVRTAPSPVVSGTLVSVIVSAMDVCTGQIIRRADGLTLDPATVSFHVDENHGFAALTAIADGLDISTGAGVTFEISLSWTADGPPRAVTSAGTDDTVPGYFVVTNLRELGRPATASGTISDGTRNYSPAPSVFAEIEDVQQGAVIILRE